MPIFEFKCLECEDFFEMLFMNDEENIEIKCPKCDSMEIERVLSTSSYSMCDGPGEAKRANIETKKCSSGSCTTYNIPGHSK